MEQIKCVCIEKNERIEPFAIKMERLSINGMSRFKHEIRVCERVGERDREKEIAVSVR